MATLQQKAKAIVAAEKRLKVVQKRRDKAASRLQSAEELQAAYDTAQAQFEKSEREVEWVRARPIEGEDENTQAELEALLAELRPAETSDEDEGTEAGEDDGAETADSDEE